MVYSIIGGDDRMIYLAEMLRESGNTVLVCGFENHPSNIVCCALGDALHAERVILPLPTTKDNKSVFAPFSGKEILLADIKLGIDRHSILFTAGKKFSLPREYDYFAKEDFTLKNAALTAEGAVGTAIMGSKRALLKSRILVIGYGRIGSFLCRRLRGFTNDITATYRRDDTCALIESDGFKPLNILKTEENIDKYDFIFNTVPNEVLSENALKKIKENATVTELASPPFGFNHSAAAALGINVIIASGLPAKVSPVSAAEIIYAAVTGAFTNGE